MRDPMYTNKGNIDNEENPVDLSDIVVLKRHYNAMYREMKYFGLRYISDDEAAVEDLVQDVWLRIWERKDKFENESSFRHYVMMSLHNAIMNHVKHDRVVRCYEDRCRDSGPETEEEVSRRIIESEVYQALNIVFEELPDSCRRVYAASLDGKTQKEIAQMFNITVNTVKKHINKANHYMRRRIQDFLSFLLMLG